MEDVYEEGVPSKLYIIGNGFDLALGAKTTYSAFYECLKECSASFTLEEFGKSYYYEGNKESVDSFYELVKNNAENYFINYFLNYKKAFGNWVSFERELTKIVKGFDDLLSALNSSERLVTEEKTGSDCYTEISLNILDLRDLLQILFTYPRNKFFEASIEHLENLEKGQSLVFKICKRRLFGTAEVYKKIEDFSEELPRLLYEDLMVFSDLFALYLDIVEHYVNTDSLIKDQIEYSSFINYNFTDYLERSMKHNDHPFKDIIYINGHAKYDLDKSGRGIVFGIDSNTKLSNPSFEVFTKRIQRSIMDTDVSKLAEVLYECFDEIHIFGHSLNFADYESLSFVFSKYTKYKPKVYVYCLDRKSKIELIVNLKLILGSDRFDEYQREGKLFFPDSKSFWFRT